MKEIQIQLLCLLQKLRHDYKITAVNLEKINYDYKREKKTTIPSIKNAAGNTINIC